MKPAVDTAQTAWEFDRLLEIVHRHEPESILEVGVWEGGTLWHWLQEASRVVAIDDAMRPPGADVWLSWARDAECDLHLLHGLSQADEVLKAASELGGYDMVFIDADHTYESAHADWLNFLPLLEPDGIVVFHDIRARDSYGVDRLWEQVKNARGARTLEIVEAGNASANGIGVVWPR